MGFNLPHHHHTLKVELHILLINNCDLTWAFSLSRNLLPSPFKLLRVTPILLLTWVRVHPLQCILVYHLMVLLYSTVHLYLPMMCHFLGDQHTITTMAAGFLQAAPTDRCIYLGLHLIRVDLWWETVCSLSFSTHIFLNKKLSWESWKDIHGCIFSHTRGSQTYKYGLLSKRIIPIRYYMLTFVCDSYLLQHIILSIKIIT